MKGDERSENRKVLKGCDVDQMVELGLELKAVVMGWLDTLACLRLPESRDLIPLRKYLETDDFFLRC